MGSRSSKTSPGPSPTPSAPVTQPSAVSSSPPPQPPPPPEPVRTRTEFPTPSILRDYNQYRLNFLAKKNKPRRDSDGKLLHYPPLCGKDQLFAADEYKKLDELAAQIPEELLQRPIKEVAAHISAATTSPQQFARVAYRWVSSLALSAYHSVVAATAAAETKTTEAAVAVVVVDSNNGESSSTDAPDNNLSALDYAKNIKSAKMTLSNLLHDILRCGGLEVEIIDGIVKSDLPQSSPHLATTTLSEQQKSARFIVDEIGGSITSLVHRKWLAVAINDSWYLIDPIPTIEYYLENQPKETYQTQQAGISEKNSSADRSATVSAETRRKPNIEGYFMPDPVEFIYSHIPTADESWQLLYCPVNAEEFIEMADFTSAFFRYRLQSVGCPRRTVDSVSAKNGIHRLIFELPPNSRYRFNYRLTSADEDQVDPDLLDRLVAIENVPDEGQIVCSLRFQRNGSYNFELYCCSADDEEDVALNVSRLVCRYRIEVTRTAGDVTPLPRNRLREWGPSWMLKQAGLDAITNRGATIDVDTTGEVELTFALIGDAKCYEFWVTSDPVDKVIKGQHALTYNDEDRNIVIAHVKFVETGFYAIRVFRKNYVDTGLRLIESTDTGDVSKHAEVCCYLARVTQATSKKRSYPRITNQQLGPTDFAAKLNIVSVSHRKSYIQASDDGELSLNFSTPTHRCKFNAELYLQTDTEGEVALQDCMVFVEERSDGATFLVRFPEKGFYSIRISGCEQTADGQPLNYAPVYEYVVDVDCPTAKFGSFPRKFAGWTEGCRLVRPADPVGVLPANSLIPFAAVIPGANLVRVVRSDQIEVMLTKGASVQSGSPEQWSVDLQTGREGDLTLMASFGETAEYKLLLGFQVIDTGRSKKSQLSSAIQKYERTRTLFIEASSQRSQNFTDQKRILAPTMDDGLRKQLQQLRASEVVKNQTSPASTSAGGDSGNGPWWDAYRRKFEGLDAKWERVKELERKRRAEMQDGKLKQPGQKTDIDVDVGRDLERIRTALQTAVKRFHLTSLLVALHEAVQLNVHGQLGSDYDRAKKVTASLIRVNKLKSALLGLDRATLIELRDMNNPPEPLRRLVSAALLVLGFSEELTETAENCQHLFTKTKQKDLLRKVVNFDVSQLHPDIAARALELLNDCSRQDIRKVCFGATVLFDWTTGVCSECLSLLGAADAKPATGERQKELLQQTISN